MSIEFHCPQCSKLIRAPESAGGKHGKCPYCKAKVYVPMPPEEGDEISLAPVDEAEEQRERELKKEAVRYAAAVGKETDPPPSTDDALRAPKRSAGRRTEAPSDLDDMGEAIEQFVIAMRDSKLDDADRIVVGLKRARIRARDHIETLMTDPPSPPFGGVPEALFRGFLKTLLDRLG